VANAEGGSVTELELERRDELALRKVSGHPLTESESAELAELNATLDSEMPNEPRLPPEVLALVNEVLGR
jgi:hypothetical protein